MDDWYGSTKDAYETVGGVGAFSTQGLKPMEVAAIERYFTAPARVLDLGCGTGRTSVELAKRGFDVDAIDYAPPMIEKAKELHAERNVRFAVMDASALSFADATFDYVLFSFNGLDYLYPQALREKTLREVRRVLKPGGIFAFTSHNSLWIPSRWAKIKMLARSFLHGKIVPYRIEWHPWGTVISHTVSPWAVKRELIHSGLELLTVMSTSSTHLLLIALRDPYPMYVARATNRE